MDARGFLWGERMKNKKKRLVLRAVILVVIVAALGYTIYQMFNEKHVVEAGEQAPNFMLETLSGEKAQLKDFRGKGVLLNFWGTWCKPCKYEMPHLQEAYENYKDKGVVVVAVDIRESKLAVQTFADRYNLTFPMLLDREGEVTENTYVVGRIPSTYLINSKGKVIEKKVGPFQSVEDVEKAMEKIVPQN